MTRFLPTAEEQARPRGRRGFFGLAASGVAAALVATSITAAVLPASDDRTWPWHVADILIYSAAFILAAATLDGYWTPARRLLGIGKPAAGAGPAAAEADGLPPLGDLIAAAETNRPPQSWYGEASPL